MTRDQFMSLTDQQKWDTLLLAESERDDFERQLAELRATAVQSIWEDMVNHSPPKEFPHLDIYDMSPVKVNGESHWIPDRAVVWDEPEPIPHDPIRPEIRLAPELAWAIQQREARLTNATSPD